MGEVRENLNPEGKIRLKPKRSHEISPGPPGCSVALILGILTVFMWSMLITAQTFKLYGLGN